MVLAYCLAVVGALPVRTIFPDHHTLESSLLLSWIVYIDAAIVACSNLRISKIMYGVKNSFLVS